MGKIKVLIPEYLKNFECIGSECEDSCCKNWFITVDKNTYKKYKSIKKGEFSPLLNNNIIVNKHKSGTGDYAYINLDENHKCPFLQDNLLCSVYINLGEEYMPKTCKIYPRIVNKVNDEIEISLILSCPEAVRKALLENKTMKFEYADMEFKSYMKSISRDVGTDFERLKNKEYAYFWDIRIASIKFLQNKKFDISKRLTLIGFMYKKIQKCIDEKRFKDIPIEIAKFVNIVENENNIDFLQNINTNKGIQIFFSRMLFDNKRIGRNFSDKLLNYINDFMGVVAFDENEDIDEKISINNDILNRYNSIIKDRFNPYLEENGSDIIENYLVNEYFRLCMPFGPLSDIWKSLIVLCTSYCVLKNLIIGYLSKNQSISNEIMVDIIYSMSRELTHNTNYYDFMVKNIKEYNLDTLGGLYIMIEN